MGAYVEAPNEYVGGGPSLFLAGGITGCSPWQADIANQLAELALAVLNPCRAHFPMGDPAAGQAQIAWEYRHLRKATACLFWFPCETLCPITLYELGGWSMTAKPLFVGTHPEYQRRFDVIVQLQLARPEVEVVDSLAKLVDQVKHWE